MSNIIGSDCLQITALLYLQYLQITYKLHLLNILESHKGTFIRTAYRREPLNSHVPSLCEASRRGLGMLFYMGGWGAKLKVFVNVPDILF